MTRRFVWLTAALGIVACTAEPLGPPVEGVCIAVLRHEGALYTIADVPYQGSFQPADSVGAVVRNVGCNDTPEPGDPPATELIDGDSNFLPVGAILYAVEGFAPNERLAVRPDTIWILLEAGRI